MMILWNVKIYTDKNECVHILKSCNIHTPIVIVDTYGMLNVTWSTFKNTRHRDQTLYADTSSSSCHITYSSISTFTDYICICLMGKRQYTTHYASRTKIRLLVGMCAKTSRLTHWFSPLIDSEKQLRDLCVDNKFIHFYLFISSFASFQIQQLVLTFSPE